MLSRSDAGVWDLTSQPFDPYGMPNSVDEQAESSFGWNGEQIVETIDALFPEET